MTDKIPFEDLKDGDFLVKEEHWVFILDHFEAGLVRPACNAFLYKALFTLGQPYGCCRIPMWPTRGIGYYEECRQLRYATNYEREQLLEELRARRYGYNEERKRVERIFPQDL